MKFLVLDILGIYKAFLSPFLPPACRFEPTCSEYAREAVEKYGALRNMDGPHAYLKMSAVMQGRA